MVICGISRWTGPTMDSQTQRQDVMRETAARLADVRHGIDDLLEQVAELRAVRLRQLADARSSRTSRGIRVPSRSNPAT
jgi:hypothetical protein